MRRFIALSAVAVLVSLTGGVAGAVSAPTATAANVFPLVQGSSNEPAGDLVVTESTPGQLTVGDVISFKLADSGSAATLHLVTTPSVGGSNGLAGTGSIASSAPGLNDIARVTITAPSAGSFPGVLTVTNLNLQVDPTAAMGNDIVSVSDS